MHLNTPMNGVVARPAIFIDRDDTLIYNVPYLSDPDLVRLTPGAGKALAALQRAGFLVIMITNQSGVGRGLFTLEQLGQVHIRLKRILLDEGVVLDGIYYCPHAPWENCNCRKPKTGMLEQACQEHFIDIERSIMVGDSSGDVEMGRAFGLKTVQLRLPDAKPKELGADLTVETLPEMVDFVMARM